MTSQTPPAKRKTPPAIRFLWVVGGLTLLAVLLAVLYRMFEPQLWRYTMVPKLSFAASPVEPRADYGKAEARAWVARPGLVPNPSLDAPAGFQAAPTPPVDVFFIAPTTYFQNQRWNAPLGDAASNGMLDQVARQMASPFNGIGAIYAPRYRQATFGAFFADGSPDSLKAFDLAYGDVLAAFDAFQAARGAGKGPQRPFILAAHSQGSLHALRLLKDRFGAPAVQTSLVAAYIIGWPVSVEADLTPVGLKPCETPQATGCVISWQSFGAQGTDTASINGFFQASTSAFGVPRKGTQMLCSNPITGWMGGKEGAREANLGALAFVAKDKPLGALLPRLTGASCNKDGFLLLSPNPGAPFDERKMPGENYHTYDFLLFWANTRANAEARVSAFYAPR
jgi:hypothetical protein